MSSPPPPPPSQNLPIHTTGQCIYSVANSELGVWLFQTGSWDVVKGLYIASYQCIHAALQCEPLHVCSIVQKSGAASFPCSTQSYDYTGQSGLGILRGQHWRHCGNNQSQKEGWAQRACGCIAKVTRLPQLWISNMNKSCTKWVSDRARSEVQSWNYLD